MLQLLKKILGKNLTQAVRPFGHGAKAYLAAAHFGFPAKKLKLVGITGTKGKTTTTLFTGRLMNLAGLKTGYISTAALSLDGQSEILNHYKMTSIDPFLLQKFLSQMLKNGCEYAVLEMSSQGLAQNRHRGLFGFDVALFLNIFPEHIEAHGSWEIYREAKSLLPQALRKGGIFIGNSQDHIRENSEFMWQRALDKKPDFNLQKILFNPYQICQILPSPEVLYKQIGLEGKSYSTRFLADFEVENLMFAYQTVKIFQANYTLNLENFNFSVPGRMEFVVQNGQIV